MPSQQRAESMIRHLTHLVCPECSAPLCAEEVTGRHVNGQQFESRRFKCSAVLRWIPNFERMEVSTVCPNSDAERSKRELAKQTMQIIKDALADKVIWSESDSVSIEYTLLHMLNRKANETARS